MSNELNTPPFPALSSYRLITQFTTEFQTGNKPNWLSTISTGDATVSFEESEGGHVLISTGTAGIGDFGKIRMPDFDPRHYDAVAITLVSSGPVDQQAALNRSEISNSSVNNAVISRGYDRFDARINGAEYSFKIPGKDWEARSVQQTFVWDIKGNQMWCLTGGMMSQPVTICLDPSVGLYTLEPFKIVTLNTEARFRDLKFYQPLDC